MNDIIEDIHVIESDIDKVDELGKYYYQLNKSLRVYKYGNRRKRKYENDDEE
jgi:hypothetical protein